MSDSGYNQFCPVSMAAEIICSRWTLLVLRELVLGSNRFNELRRGLPSMSPALLSKRLKDLEAAGIVVHAAAEREPGVLEYRLTEAGNELRSIIEAIGVWGHRWVTTEATLKNLDANLLMWDIRRNINTDPMPARRNTIQFIFNDRPSSERNYWLIVEPGAGVDLCLVDPGFDVDLYVSTDLRTMTEIWLGYAAISAVSEDGRLILTGNPKLAADLRTWLKLSMFANSEKRVA
ncbi:helix-turn-helix transcriptional regulator [Bradyrhizobium sp. ISRA443]|uniref:winged helix-turn-helix transcriptional regulator n=1 Tax=unclassified Bradyrhizobium TaxID=2631580 RepID=UPI00247A314C|nr:MULTISPECIES: helix-turn-helix domain-containing protein [unclassified Bradyrhizobium]WGS01704.1 helix-turn-helix transcriptional regulator [Bradyrhizobium sp. ISRA436]WGS08590.1 helix-turn-helix transcriptional regulator [Bradyrhizobium sp. ISRA437]WGS15478.1 helix-turn-helix transcriptional regulator [Bradyrhizobium sp. ISRA443]